MPKSGKSSKYYIGRVMFVLGVLLAVNGLTDFFSAFYGSGFPSRFPMLFVAIPLIAIGLSMGSKGNHLKNSDNVSYNGEKPVDVPYLPPISKTPNGIMCGCGELNDINTRFCINCGRELKLECKSCSSLNAHDAVYCKKCGNKL